MSMLRKTKQQIAHTSMIPSLGNRDLRSLQDIINSEKAFIKSNSTAGQAWHSNAESLKAWGDGEGDDLGDIMSKMSLLLDNYTTAHTRLNTHLSTLRLHFKSIRTREEGLAELKARKRTLQSRIESVEKKLSKMGPENKELMKTTSTLKEHRSEMESLNIELATEEAALGDFKRRTTKEAMGLKCGGLLEFAEKVTIIAEIGKMIIDEIPLAQTKPGMPRADYNSHARTEQLLQEAARAISDVGFAPSGGPSGGHARPDLSHLDSSLPINDEYGGGSDNAISQFVRQTGGVDEENTTGANYDDQYTAGGGNGTYDSQADYNTTPIYASHQTTQPWLKDSASARSLTQQGQQVHTEGLQEGSEWQHQHQQHDVGHTNDATSSAIPAQDAGWGTSSVNDQHAARDPSPDRYRPVGDDVPAATQQRQDSLDAAPSLPPLRASSPLPSNAGQPTGTTPSAVPPATMDDESYFTSIGSTRAAQAAARRPHSPTPSASFGGAPSLGAAVGGAGSSSNITTTIPTTPSGSTYEPSESGRKMTAAAFRKGFNRGPPSGQLSRPMDDSVPSRENTASPSIVPPLAIRKRQSAIVDAEPTDHEAVPPYLPPQESQPQDDAYNTGYGYAAPPAPPAVGQIYNNGSRPGSSAGHQQQHGGYNLPGYASYAAGPGPNGGPYH